MKLHIGGGGQPSFRMPVVMCWVRGLCPLDWECTHRRLLSPPHLRLLEGEEGQAPGCLQGETEGDQI
jgi:hypothetical protein